MLITGASPSGKAVDSDSTIPRVQILPPQPAQQIRPAMRGEFVVRNGLFCRLRRLQKPHCWHCFARIALKAIRFCCTPLALRSAKHRKATRGCSSRLVRLVVVFSMLAALCAASLMARLALLFARAAVMRQNKPFINI